MTSHSTSQLKHQSAATPAHRNLLLAAASMLALNCTAAPLETEDATTPNAGILMVAQGSQAAEGSDATTLNAGVWMLADGSQSAGTNAQASEPWPEPDATDEELEPLRHAAMRGDATACLQLVGELVDRFENTRGNGDLYEALLWIDRFQEDDQIARSPTITLISARHCEDQAMRGHWLCGHPTNPNE